MKGKSIRLLRGFLTPGALASALFLVVTTQINSMALEWVGGMEAHVEGVVRMAFSLMAGLWLERDLRGVPLAPRYLPLLSWILSKTTKFLLAFSLLLAWDSVLGAWAFPFVACEIATGYLLMVVWNVTQRRFGDQ